MPSTTIVPLKYWFFGTYKDGTKFSQNKEDVSIVDPKRSSFYDVKQDDVRIFCLDIFKLDLETGRFYTDDCQFYTGDPGPKPYKLIFYRQHIHNFNIGLDELSHEVKYCIGYVDANGVEHKIYID